MPDFRPIVEVPLLKNFGLGIEAIFRGYSCLGSAVSWDKTHCQTIEITVGRKAHANTVLTNTYLLLSSCRHKLDFGGGLTVGFP